MAIQRRRKVLRGPGQNILPPKLFFSNNNNLTSKITVRHNNKTIKIYWIFYFFFLIFYNLILNLHYILFWSWFLMILVLKTINFIINLDSLLTTHLRVTLLSQPIIINIINTNFMRSSQKAGPWAAAPIVSSLRRRCADKYYV